MATDPNSYQAKQEDDLESFVKVVYARMFPTFAKHLREIKSSDYQKLWDYWDQEILSAARSNSFWGAAFRHAAEGNYDKVATLLLSLVRAQ